MKVVPNILVNSVEWQTEETRRDIAEFSLSNSNEKNTKSKNGAMRYGIHGDLFTAGISYADVDHAGVTSLGVAETNTYPSVISSGTYHIGPAVSVRGSTTGAVSIGDNEFYVKNWRENNDGVWLWNLNVTWPAGTFAAGTHTISLTDGTKTVSKSATSHDTTEPISLSLSHINVKSSTSTTTVTPTITPTPTTSSAAVHFSLMRISGLDSNSIGTVVT